MPNTFTGGKMKMKSTHPATQTPNFPAPCEVKDWEAEEEPELDEED